MNNKTFKKMLLGMAMASPLALINSGNVHASSVKTNVGTNWHANSLATVQQELRNQNINPDYKITNAKYIVQAGDTLSQIAAATHINMYHIAAVNHIQNLNLIYVGQVLILNQGNEVAHNVAGNGSTTAASIGNTYTLRSTSQQPVLNYYGHTQSQGTTGTPNVQKPANVNSQGAPAAKQPAKTIISSASSANNNNQNVKPATPTGNTGVNTGSTQTPSASSNPQQPASSASSSAQPVVSSSAIQGGESSTSQTTGSNASSATQQTPTVSSSSQQTGVSSSSQQKQPVISSSASSAQNTSSSASSATQQTPSVSSSSQQTGVSSSTTQGSVSSSSQQSTTSSSSSQQPASSASSTSSASQVTSSSQTQGSVSSSQTTTSSSTQQPASSSQSSVSSSSHSTTSSSSSQQPAQSSSSQSSTSSSSQHSTTSSSSSKQPTSSASSASQSSATSSSQSSASSSSQSSASSSSQQKTVDGYTLDNMPLSVFNDKKNLDAINNTFSGDEIENYFNNHIGKGNMTWDEAQQAQQNGQVTSAILAWNGQMLPTQMSQDMAKNNGTLANAIYNWRGMLPTSYLNGDNQMTEINKQYGSLDGDTLNEAQSEKLTSYLNSLLNTYSSGKSTNPQLQEVANKRAEELTSYSHDGFENVNAKAEVLADLGNINSFQNKSMFDVLANSAYGMYQWIYDDADSNWGHRDNLKNYNNWAFSIKVLSNGEVILIGEGR